MADLCWQAMRASLRDSLLNMAVIKHDGSGGWWITGPLLSHMRLDLYEEFEDETTRRTQIRVYQLLGKV
jgi:hypothetical protein